MVLKMIKKDEKTSLFGLFEKIKSLVLSGIVVKQKLLWSFNILQRLYTLQKSGSQVIMAKNGTQPMRFQYSLIVNISLIDWYLTLVFGMYQIRNWVYQQVLRNILVWANWPILGPKMRHPYNYGSIVNKI